MPATTPAKPLKVWGELGPPNPFKIGLVLRELSIPYEVVPMMRKDIKAPPFLAVNPNGRVPALHDPNTGVTIWESGAIIEYLIATYDTEHKISFPAGTIEHWHTIQWLYFQASGQGPYYGQGVWFQVYHEEKIPSAIERYQNEMRRVCGVLEGWLGGTLGTDVGEGKVREYLVGDKYTFADVAFVPWQLIVKVMMDWGGQTWDEEKEFPHMHRWLQRITSREVVKATIADKEVKYAAMKKAEEEAAKKEEEAKKAQEGK
ncbi:hypothetical protein FQN50_002470 [Emmonsiellopsis sp. PD_5]|nr:hypothetical protein FQN50_002470 [Emmonsiellopsis sp. PD_5]